MNDGLTGLGFAHAMHPRADIARTRQPSTDASLSLRWSERWEAACAAESKKAADPAEEFAVLRHRYNLRMRRLLTANISWKTILKDNLDSPLSHSVEFDRALCLAINRRRKRLGRRKDR